MTCRNAIKWQRDIKASEKQTNKKAGALEDYVVSSEIRRVKTSVRRRLMCSQRERCTYKLRNSYPKAGAAQNF